MGGFHTHPSFFPLLRICPLALYLIPPSFFFSSFLITVTPPLLCVCVCKQCFGVRRTKILVLLREDKCCCVVCAAKKKVGGTLSRIAEEAYLTRSVVRPNTLFLLLSSVSLLFCCCLSLVYYYLRLSSFVRLFTLFTPVNTSSGRGVCKQWCTSSAFISSPALLCSLECLFPLFTSPRC